jgi:cytochrome c-type biogenesis protein CcmH/NrfF
VKLSTLLRRQNLRKLVFLSLLLVTPVTRAADRARVMEMGENFTCICGCTQILSRCNHLGCPSSQPMLKELAAMIDSGQTEEQIIAKYAEKYGYTVLSSPPASGFNLLAYLLPLAALVGGAIIAVFVARTWRTTAVAQGQPIDNVPTATREKIEKELREFTPED